MDRLRAVFCNWSEFSESSMTSEIDPLRALLSLIYNLLYRIFPHLCSRPREESNNKGENVLVQLFFSFDAITMQGMHSWALHSPAERSISFVLPVLFPISVEHLLPVPRQIAAWPIVFKTQAACSLALKTEFYTSLSWNVKLPNCCCFGWSD